MNMKELPVLPEPEFFATDQTDRFNDVIYREGYDADQLQAYGAACAAHAREVALEEAARVSEKYFHSTTAKTIRAKKAGK